MLLQRAQINSQLLGARLKQALKGQTPILYFLVNDDETPFHVTFNG